MIPLSARAWIGGVDRAPLARRLDLRARRLRPLSSGNSTAAVARLAEDGLPLTADQGGPPTGLFTTGYGSRTPRAVMPTE
jgi:hypothetical protein